MWAALSAFLFAVAGPLAIKVLKSLGVGVVTFVGVGSLLTYISDSIKTNYLGAPAHVVQIMSLFGFDHALSIVITAFSIRLTLNGLDSATGSLKLWGRG